MTHAWTAQHTRTVACAQSTGDLSHDTLIKTLLSVHPMLAVQLISVNTSSHASHVPMSQSYIRPHINDQCHYRAPLYSDILYYRPVCLLR